jgi:predicted dehydrogenase
MRVGIVDIDIMHGEEIARLIQGRPGGDFEGVAVTHWFSTTDRARTRGTYHPGDRPPFDPAAVTREYGIPHAVSRPEEMIGAVDAVLICSRFGDNHLVYARPFLAAGVPTFLDKPASDSVADTREILRLVRAREVPFLCSSLWKFTPPMEGLLRALPDLGEVRTAVCTGPGHDELFFYGTHVVETVQAILGYGAEHVVCLADEKRYAILLQMADGRVGFANAVRHTAVVRHVAVYGERGYAQVEIDEPARQAGLRTVVARFLRTVRGEEPPYPLELVEEATAILAAAERSMAEGGRRVYLHEVAGAQGVAEVSRAR